MDNTRREILNDEIPINEKIKESLNDIGRKPHKLSLLFWLFFIQICVAVFLLLCSIILPFTILL